MLHNRALAEGARGCKARSRIPGRDFSLVAPPRDALRGHSHGAQPALAATGGTPLTSCLFQWELAGLFLDNSRLVSYCLNFPHSIPSLMPPPSVARFDDEFPPVRAVGTFLPLRLAVVPGFPMISSPRLVPCRVSPVSEQQHCLGQCRTSKRGHLADALLPCRRHV